MSNSQITMERFRSVLKAYGAGEAAWPEDLRKSMRDFLKETPAAHAHLADEQRLDAALAIAPEPDAADNALAARIEAAFVREKQAGSAPAPTDSPAGLLDLLRLALPGRSLVPQLTGLAAAALFGILLGLQGMGGPQQYEIVDASAYLVGNPALAQDLETINR